MILVLEADEASGKTTLSYTPLPIVGFSFDMGHTRAINGKLWDKYFKGLDIKVVRYDPKAPSQIVTGDIVIYELPSQIQLDTERMVGCSELWNYFVGLASAAAQDSAVKTIVVDTMTLARRLKGDAYLQDLQRRNPQQPRKQLTQIEWGHANDTVRDVYNMCAALGKNLVATHHLTDERKPSVGRDGQVENLPTGQKVLEGYNRTYQHADIVLRMSAVKGHVEAVYEKCGYEMGLKGSTLVDPDWNMIVRQMKMVTGYRIPFDERER